MRRPADAVILTRHLARTKEIVVWHHRLCSLMQVHWLRKARTTCITCIDLLIEHFQCVA